MSEAFVGEIRMFAGNYAPEGWTLCDGKLLSINDNQALYSLLGTLYGGNGSNTFAVPDYSGRLVVGAGTGPGLTPRVLPTTTGLAEVTMRPENTPSHTHAFMASTGAATSAEPSPTTSPGKMTFGKFPGAGIITGLYSKSSGTSATHSLNSGFLGTALIPPSINATPHSNLMGSLSISYIICLVGLYPTRPQ
ncbi:phage tail protein [Aeromonas hydrophila]|uniref:phage tail protein n=1 Tax=Aeromonas hydrophila TaxID=644 RepID=UPI00301A0CA9